jgi:hypothetical protein
MIWRASLILVALVVACRGSSDGGAGGSAGDGGQGGAGGSDVFCVESVCPCDEAGIGAAVAEGGGPFTFDCDGPTTVVTEEAIVIDNDVVLDGEGNLTVDGNGAHRVFWVSETVTAELREVTVTNGSVGVYNLGGGILNEGTLTLTDSTVWLNIAGGGGGISNLGDGTLTVTNSTVSLNTARYGGGIENDGSLTLSNSTVVWNNADVGGGIFNEGPLALTDSTVWGNVAFQGGGITNQSRTLTVTNSTVSLNTARYGGGIENQADGLLTLTNSTVSGNAAPNGGGIYNVDGGELTASGTLINNDCLGDPALPGGHNIESPGDTCGFDQGTDLVNVSVDDLKLGPLQDNGGPTQTHALLPGSVAIDHIPAADCEVDEDQRGELRPGGAMCDAGAFEVQP